MTHIKNILLAIALLMVSSTFAQQYQLPKYETYTLKNGLTIYLMEQHEVPLINVSAVLPAGAIYDYNQAGLASFTAAALKHGTKNYPKEKLDAALDFIGASINTYATKEYAGLSAKFAAKDRNTVFDIIKELLTQPVFDVKEFDKEQKRILTGLDQAKESPRAVIDSYFDRLLFDNHEYGNVIPGTTGTVKALTAKDLQQFYQKNYTPKGSAIAVVGDFNTKEMKALIAQQFDGWVNNPAPFAYLQTTMSNISRSRVLLVNKDDAKETTFYVGAKSISRNNADYVAIQVINTLFGGRFTSMLNDELRVNSGLTYGARSNFNPFKKSGTFYITTFTATETTEQAIDKALEVLNHLHKNGVDQNTLTSAKNYVKGQLPPKYETSANLSNLLTQMFWYNFNESYINNFQKAVDELSLEKAQKIIATYFPKDKLQFVLIGKASQIKKIAEKYGPVTEVQIVDGPK